MTVYNVCAVLGAVCGVDPRSLGAASHGRELGDEPLRRVEPDDRHTSESQDFSIKNPAQNQKNKFLINILNMLIGS